MKMTDRRSMTKNQQGMHHMMKHFLPHRKLSMYQEHTVCTEMTVKQQLYWTTFLTGTVNMMLSMMQQVESNKTQEDTRHIVKSPSTLELKTTFRAGSASIQ